MKHYPSQAVMAFVAGVIFAVGLALSGMTQPQKVIGFLQLGEGWDPSLMFVMLAAIPVHMLSYRWIRGRRSPLLDTRWHIPETKDVTKSLIAGSLLFGIGWGLGGFCPGPALTSLGAGHFTAVVFVVAMLAGMGLHAVYVRVSGKN
ncbi:DUF6691 family protein [Bdellovibrio bacteriovorus]|uniref:Uncharacterized protein n=1 Tax=Bdellovibrio bacteriovorus str. Tiberius TaxID=1069642 RepID=K7YWA7_BDEBC|nr:DUF6691 family protein [Bdellovibrio bacteriovorus]AFY00980.1 hypothetical protein Bdt_1281 [Bdellovibrio bacteriovorus str. Tiberius]